MLFRSHDFMITRLLSIRPPSMMSGSMTTLSSTPQQQTQTERKNVVHACYQSFANVSSDHITQFLSQVFPLIACSYTIVGLYTHGDTEQVNKRSDVMQLHMRKALEVIKTEQQVLQQQQQDSSSRSLNSSESQSLLHVHLMSSASGDVIATDEKQKKLSVAFCKRYELQAALLDQRVASKQVKCNIVDNVSLKVITGVNYKTLNCVCDLNVNIPVFAATNEEDKNVSLLLGDVCANSIENWFHNLLFSSKQNKGHSMFVMNGNRVLREGDTSAIITAADEECDSIQLMVHKWTQSMPHETSAHVGHAMCSIQLKQLLHTMIPVVPNKTTVDFVVKQLKKDIISSVMNRFDLFCTHIEHSSNKEYAGLMSKPLPTKNELITGEWNLLANNQKRVLVLDFPHRVFISGQAGFCDYVLPGETEKEVVQRMRKLLAVAENSELELMSKEKPLLARKTTDSNQSLTLVSLLFAWIMSIYVFFKRLISSHLIKR